MSSAGSKRATLTMPRLGETMERGVVANWLLDEGAAFRRGDAIIEFETDKTAVEFPALGNGLLFQKLVGPGDEVSVGDPIALVDVDESDNWLDRADNTGTDDEHDSLDVADGSADPKTTAEHNQSLAEDSGSVRATPAARKLAKEQGVLLSEVHGTGRRGRIEVQDIHDVLAGRFRQPSTTEPFGAFASRVTSHIEGIACYASGPESGTAYLLLHGFAANASTWSSLSRALNAAGARVMSVDLPGHGATHTETENADSLHTGLREVAVATDAEQQGVHIVAHSLGAIPALQLAQSSIKPEMTLEAAQNTLAIASLTLVAPFGMGLSVDAEFIRGMAEPTSAGELSHLIKRLSRRPSTLSVEALDQLFRELKRGRLVNLAESMLGRLGQQLDCGEAVRLVSKKLPVRIILGHEDRIVKWQDALDVSPDVAVHHFPQAGHMPHWDYPDDVARIILSATV